MLDVRETLVEDWKYVAEGGATVVLSYGGPDLRYIGTVLRLRKSSRRRRTPPTTSVVDAEDFGVEFHEHIVSRLVPKKFLPPRLERCIIAPPFEWIEAVAGLVENQRPASRRTEDGIDVSRCTGILATDLVGGASWAVEIKVSMSTFDLSFLQ
jgi:inositol-pentakisphosphate 2-kinase